MRNDNLKQVAISCGINGIAHHERLRRWRKSVVIRHPEMADLEALKSGG